MVPLGSGTNVVDAAIAGTTTALARTEILGIGEPTPSYTLPAVGTPVKKAGRTTGLTNGTISTVNLTALVNYGSGCGLYQFTGQLEITPGTFSGAGDSGSSILNSGTNEPVGLLFAGSSASTIANDIRHVYQGLNVFVESSAGLAPSEQEISRMVNAAKDPE
jgi:hypothetical protein